ncbi:MAG: glycerol-3-phosphate 1-O-acyltransferase PlsY [Nitrospirae bacterium]|nr:glycerol-3-phosphate 1-O-acyltransferase PlsY [Nitrospirota bacterium]
MAKEIAVVLLAYLLGSIPTGLLLAKAKGIDIRTVGSGNIGATNVTRNLGKALGAVTLIGDLLKGVLPVVLARIMDFSSLWIAAAALAAFCGHVFTVFLKLKGGKGVATAFGVFLGIQPSVALIAAGVWLVMFAIFRYSSVGSLSAATAFPVALWIIRDDKFLTVLALLIALIIYLRHRENIRKLIEGTEGKFGSPKEKPATPA